MDIKEGTCCDAHWILHVSGASLNSPPETNTTLYVKLLNFKLKKNKTVAIKQSVDEQDS